MRSCSPTIRSPACGSPGAHSRASAPGRPPRRRDASAGSSEPGAGARRMARRSHLPAARDPREPARAYAARRAARRGDTDRGRRDRGRAGWHDTRGRTSRRGPAVPQRDRCPREWREPDTRSPVRLMQCGSRTARSHATRSRRRRIARGARRLLYRLLIKPQDNAITRYLFRPMSLPLTKLLVKTPITPNQVSALVGMMVAIGCWLTASVSFKRRDRGEPRDPGSGYLDCCDGEIARLKLMSSKLGAWLDTIVDELSTMGYMAALGYHCHLPVRSSRGSTCGSPGSSLGVAPTGGRDLLHLLQHHRWSLPRQCARARVRPQHFRPPRLHLLGIAHTSRRCRLTHAASQRFLLTASSPMAGTFEIDHLRCACAAARSRPRQVLVV